MAIAAIGPGSAAGAGTSDPTGDAQVLAPDAGAAEPVRPAQRGEIVGRAPRVIDGDTLEVRAEDGGLLRIRLAGIDAPEHEQPWGDAARIRLGTLVGDGPLRLRIVKQDRYGRSVADAWRGDTNLALAQLQAGLAWHFRRYAAEQPRRQRQAYAEAELEARAARRGLWADASPQAPWDWRRARWDAGRGTGVETITGGPRTR